VDASGNLYGTTSEAGLYGGTGTVYKVTPDGDETLLYSFGDFGKNPWDGGAPYAGVIADSKGNLHGTTTTGGAHGGGKVYRLTPMEKKKSCTRSRATSTEETREAVLYGSATASLVARPMAGVPTGWEPYLRSRSSNSSPHGAAS
jgi:uncharacterized repeat protein (TIGR03803 family)